MIRWRRPLLLAGTFAVLAAAASCFEPPIREELALRFLANGAVIVESRVGLAGDPSTDNRALERRMREARQDFAAGTDPWSRRFAELEPAAEERQWDKRLGELREVTHRALLAEPEALPRFFADTALGVGYTIADGTAELRILPGVPRALRSERETVEEWLAAWSPEVADYLAAGTRLWAYLDEHPERARACFAQLFSDLAPDAAPPPTPLQPGRESELVQAVEEAIGAVVAPHLTLDGQDASPDELSHRVFDPFPAPITVVLPGRPLAVEGFATTADGTLVAAGPGLWNAFTRLEGRWLAPDPAIVYLEGMRRKAVPGSPDFDLTPFLARQRRHAATAPSPDEVKQAIEEGLEPARLYRVVFQVDPEMELGPKDLGPFGPTP